MPPPSAARVALLWLEAARPMTTLEKITLRAVKDHGGGGTTQSLSYSVNSDGYLEIPDFMVMLTRDVRNVLLRLQRRRLVFSHDNGMSLTIWGSGVRGRFWSTREQLEKYQRYGDDEFGGPPLR